MFVVQRSNSKLLDEHWNKIVSCDIFRTFRINAQEEDIATYFVAEGDKGRNKDAGFCDVK